MDESNSDSKVTEYIKKPHLSIERRTVLNAALAGVATSGLIGSASTVGAERTTYTAVRDGYWSDPATWESGNVPSDDSNVSIQDGVTVTVAQRITTRVKYLNVTGTLRHAPDTDTKLRVETIETQHTSRYEIGTSSTPIQQGVTAEVEIIDDGPINEDKWPDRKNKGLKAHGDVEIVGAEKTPWSTLGQAPTAGDSSIELSSEPSNWNPGDRIVIPGVVPNDNQDEERAISSVDGTTVSFDTALDYDHVPPKSSFDSYALNLSRNIVFASENTDEHRRGHVMIMSTGSDVRYVRFDELGRTNKDEYLTNPVRGEDTLPDQDDPNPAARYPLHWHHTGIEAEPHYVEGAVVEGSPGWGIVNHHSHADVVDSITYSVLGAGFVSEGGNERGSFDNCIAIRSEGSGDAVDTRSHGAHGGDPAIDDFGHAGHGFWMQSPLITVTDCVAAGHRHHAFVWWLRPLLEGDLAEGTTIEDSRVTYHPNLPLEYVDTDRIQPLLDKIETGRFTNSDLIKETGKIPSTFAPLATVSGNTAFASGGGLDFSRHNFKWKHERWSDFNVVDDMTVHSIGTFIDSNGGEHSPDLPRHRASGHQGRGGNVGVAFRYTSNYGLTNSEIIGTGREDSVGRPFHDYLWTALIENCTFENWDWGVGAGEHRIDWIRNCDFNDNVQDIAWVFDNVGPTIVDDCSLDSIRHKFVPMNQKASEVFGFNQSQGVRVDGRTSYVKESAGDYIPFPDSDSLYGVNNLDDVFDNPSEIVGMTNNELMNQYGVAIGGDIMPDDAVDESFLDGSKADPVGGRDTSLYLDATAADSLGMFEVVSDQDVAGSECLRSTGSSSPKDNPASITFDCGAGTYTIYSRIWTSSWNGDTVYFRVDGGDWLAAEKLKPASGFNWFDVSPNGGEPYEIQLSEGTHTLELACGNDDVRLDEVFVTAEPEVLGGYGESTGDGQTSNIAPSASDDSVSVTNGESVTVDVLSNDSDEDGSLGASSVTVVDASSSGMTTVNSDGSIEYTHDGSDTTADSFTYTVDDDDGVTSNEATVSVSIAPIEQAPYTDHDLSQLQAEDFDTGGEGVAYHDTSDGNNGGAYRDTDVDIEAAADDTGQYNVGWIEGGEWLEYTVDVPSDGEYDLSVRLAGKNATTLDVLADNSGLATVDVPDTGDWQEWTTVDAGTVALSSGTHVFRIEANGGSFNINWFGFTEQSDTTAPEVPSNLSTDTVTTSSVDLSWDAASDSETGIAHYNVYQDGMAVKEVSAEPTSTTVSGLQDGMSYDFYVTAVDGAGNESDPSNTVTATTVEVKTVAVTGNGAANYSDNGTIRYIIETNGAIESAGTGDLESTDSAGGSEAAGKVPADGSDTDTLELTDGEIIDVSTYGGDVTVIVDGTTWSG